MFRQLLYKIWFRFRAVINDKTFFRRLWWSQQGATFGPGTNVPRLHITWPHQVSVGKACILENDIRFKFDGIWREGPSIVIGNNVFLGEGCEFNIRQHIHIADDCLIASGCKFIDHDHGVRRGLQMNEQVGNESPIVLENDVWLGVNVVVLKGVVIGQGAIVGAGAVLTKSVPPYEIWAGIPAKKIAQRT